MTPLKLPDASRNAMQDLPQQGLIIEGWKTEEQNAIELGKQAWSIQQLVPTNETQTDSSVFLLLRPQIYGGDQPEVEWIDISGLQRWKTDSHQKLQFTPLTEASESKGHSPEATVTADFFRAWTAEQTYAVMQWYAWPTGGHPSPTRWFWADQKVQWQHRQRLPWTAISLWIPIEPLGSAAEKKDLAQSIGKNVQRSLTETVFKNEGDSS